MKKLFIVLILELMTTHLWAQSTYRMAGPYEVIARDGQHRGTKVGSERDMKQALTLAKEGKTEEACAIINAYAITLKGIDGHDAPLCTIQGYDLLQAMTLLRQHKTVAWDEMVRKVWIPVLDKFEADSPYANGNWGAIVNRMRMACGIYLQDSTIYKASLDYFYHANDNGSLPKYISPTGQCQETGRDQAHVQLGLEALSQTCEMAWQQGDDLWGAMDNRMLKAFEYTAKYNLGYDVPFERWDDCTGLYIDWTEPSTFNRGRLWYIYQLPYDHFHGKKGLSMPYTKMALEVLAGKRKNRVKEGEKIHQIHTYPAPKGANLQDDYDVFIQPRGAKEWTRIDTYKALVNAPIEFSDKECAEAHKVNTGHALSTVSYAYFDFTGDVFIRVVSKHKKFKTARVRPDYRGVICNTLNDSTVQFLFFQPENVSVEFDGNIRDNLHIFTSKPIQPLAEAREEAKKAGRQFIHIPYGFYDEQNLSTLSTLLSIRKDTIDVPSNTTVYVDPGTYIKGSFLIENVQNSIVIARSVARPDRGYGGCLVYGSQNISVDGLIVNQLPTCNSDGVYIHDCRGITYPQWGDGMNVYTSSNVTYDRVFVRSSDDCTTVYASRGRFSGSCNNICMKNSTLWADVAHPIFIGIHGNPAAKDSLVNLRYENIDILNQSELQLDYQGCLAINCGDENLVKNVTFDNIRIENIDHGCPIQLKVGYNSKYCSAPGRGIENVLFRNVRYNGTNLQQSMILGYNEQRLIKNVTFEQFRINGRLIYDDMPTKPRWYKTADEANIYINDLVKDIEFKK